MNQWYEGIPPVEAVRAHETLHPRKDGVGDLGELMASYSENDHRYPRGDARVFGQWIVYHDKARNVETYTSTARLKVIEGEVFMQLGFTQWLRMESVRWKDEIRCFPVGDDGLPLGYVP